MTRLLSSSPRLLTRLLALLFRYNAAISSFSEQLEARVKRDMPAAAEKKLKEQGAEAAAGSEPLSPAAVPRRDHSPSPVATRRELSPSPVAVASGEAAAAAAEDAADGR